MTVIMKLLWIIVAVFLPVCFSATHQTAVELLLGNILLLLIIWVIPNKCSSCGHIHQGKVDTG